MKNLPQIREVSTLSFNERVLQEAEDRRNPLMERLKFLGIFSSNMDEFYKVRVASIHRRIELGKKGMAGLLESISDKTRELDERARDAYESITAELAAEGVRIVTEKDILPQSELAEWLLLYFRKSVLPSLVPMLVQRSTPFPQLKDGALYFGIKMWGEKDRYAILEIPEELPRFVDLPDGHIMYIDDVIRYALDDIFYIFPYTRIEAFAFKISRDAELDIDNDFSEGYVRKMERVLNQRKGGRPTRFVYDQEMPPGLLKILAKELQIRMDDALLGGGRYHNMKDLMRFPMKRPDLSFPRLDQLSHPVLDRTRYVPMLDTVSRQDVLVTYPYQSFDHLIRLLREAAIDPKVRSINMTLYRAARHSQVVNALATAAQNGKQITVSIELQARFDEQNNIDIAEKLREAGATVTYGVPPMKVHAKLLLIRRKGGDIAGLSTGNFNEMTGRLYVDSLLLTADKRITREVEQVFTYLENASRLHTITAPVFRHLILSPFSAREAMIRNINREKRKGPDGYIFMKVNHLTDPKILKKVRDAADAGVKMDHVVRTTYAMLPHPNIRAISILDRFLEHQRVYIFGKGADRRVYMSSADLMERNLDWRVEAAFPVYDETLKQQICDMMALQVADSYKARVLDGTQCNRYVQMENHGLRAQMATYEYLKELSDVPVLPIEQQAQQQDAAEPGHPAQSLAMRKPH
ncbi:MAG: polyphosphate kinase 1 [Candidatus Hydrogenedentes bacterium]|nr:polyphosphate kinase 1 [Candidatus Hydrogenedentota bacterium]